MNYEPILWMSAIGILGYAVFHGHKKNEDCWICPYRGMIFGGGAVVMGVVMSVNE